MTTSYASTMDLPAAVKEAVVPLLQDRLTATLDLFAQAKQAHWNVRGPQFIALHELFDRLAERMEEASDDIAERIVALGSVADGRIQTTAADTQLETLPAQKLPGSTAVRALAENLGRHGAALRQAVDATAAAGDTGSSDLLTGLSRDCDKQLWLLDAHLD